jgi:hypothetical protein
VLDLAFARGVLSGTNWAMSLLRPLSMNPRPRNPYRCPLRWFTWKLAFALGAFQVINARKDR